MRWLIRLLSIGIAALACALPATALAHPLGNFTVNRYSRLEVAADQIRLRYVVDLAEIPTFQALAELDPNQTGRLDDTRKTTYATGYLNTIIQNLHLNANGANLPLRVSSWTLDLLPGQGGLQTMRLTAWLVAPLPDASSRMGTSSLARDYRDDNEPDRIGWREIVVRPLDGLSLLNATVSSTDQSDELRSYPTDLLSSPLNIRAARATLQVTGAPAPAPVVPASRPTQAGQLVSTLPFSSILGQSTALSDVVTAGRLGPIAIAIALLLAVIWGAAHAMTPGHGKTIVAAYLVGSRGTAWHALYLGLTVTATHTVGIYALGLVTLFAAHYVLPETLFPWISLISGFAVVVIGVTLLATRFRRFLEKPVSQHNHFPLPVGSSLYTSRHTVVVCQDNRVGSEVGRDIVGE
jgi:nickel/cobalt transporter (NicO) family protein